MSDFIRMLISHIDVRNQSNIKIKTRRTTLNASNREGDRCGSSRFIPDDSRNRPLFWLQLNGCAL